MPIYRLHADATGVSRLSLLGAEAFAFENGPGSAKGVGGTVLGRASWLSLMRFDVGARMPLHRVGAGFGVLIAGQLHVTASDGSTADLVPGDAVQIAAGGARWSPANSGAVTAVLAFTRLDAGSPATDTEA